MRSKFSSLTLLIFLLFLLGCKKEPTTWDQRIQAPLLKGELDLNHILSSEELKADSSQKLRLVRIDTLISLPLDSVLQLPDTTLYESYVAPGGGTTVSPGQSLINSTDTRKLQLPNAELKRAILHEGELHYRVKSTLAERSIYEYRIPAATKNGQALTIQTSCPPGTQSEPAVVTGVKDLKGYELDLTGPNGTEVNRFQTQIKLKSDPNGQSFTLQADDSVSIRNSFKGLEPRFAKGYFGNQQISKSYTESGLSLFDHIRSGSLDIDSVNVRFHIDNGIGMDARVEVKTIRSIGQQGNVDLSHSMIGNPINVSRAQYKNGTMQHTLHTEEMTPQNSNIDLFLESIPKKIGHELELETNPLGDVSNGNDIMLRGHNVHVRMRIGLPLSLIANDLTLVDTLEWNFRKRENGKLQDGTLYIEVANGFPLSNELSLFLHDKDGKRIGTLFDSRTIAAAPVDGNWITTGVRSQRLRVQIPSHKADLLRKAEKASIVARFNTPVGAPHIDLYRYHGLKVQASADFRYQNRVE